VPCLLRLLLSQALASAMADKACPESGCPYSSQAVPPVLLQVLITFSSYHCSAVTHAVPCCRAGLTLSGANTCSARRSQSLCACHTTPPYQGRCSQCWLSLPVFLHRRWLGLLRLLCLCAGSICWCAGSGCSAQFGGAGNVQANCTAVEGVTKA
jgi:hypothetical protein